MGRSPSWPQLALPCKSWASLAVMFTARASHSEVGGLTYEWEASYFIGRPQNTQIPMNDRRDAFILRTDFRAGLLSGNHRVCIWDFPAL